MTDLHDDIRPDAPAADTVPRPQAAPGSAKPEVIDALGLDPLLLPGLVNAALEANDRAKYLLSLVQQAKAHADDPGAAVAEAARVMRPGGRLLIADFAPHNLEFLRQDYAHRRLGFSDREVKGWLEAAGLKPGDSETVAAPRQKSGESDGEKLTVILWQASAPDAPRKTGAAR